MSKSSKYILAAGCSFTHKDFTSNVYTELDTSYPKWPEIFGEYKNLPVENLGQSGVGNDYITNIVTRRILEDHKNSHLAEFLKLNNREVTNSIKEFQDLLTSHSIMNDTEPKSSLDVVLYRSIHKFIEDRIWKTKLEREKMTPPGEAPF
mgnify:CR=1 FL=1